MPAAHTDVSGGSAKLEASLKHSWKALLFPDATLMMTGNSGMSSMVAEDNGVTFMMGGGSGMAAILRADSGCGRVANLVADLNMSGILCLDSCGEALQWWPSCAVVGGWRPSCDILALVVQAQLPSALDHVGPTQNNLRFQHCPLPHPQ